MAGKLRPFPLRRGVGGSAVQVVNPQYDYVPPHLIDLFVTDNGCHTPSYIYRLLQEYYHREDYDLPGVPAHGFAAA